MTAKKASAYGVREQHMPFRHYLLDTNILLVALMTPKRLSAEVAALVSAPHNQVYFSLASLWEIGIKRSLNREHFDFSPDEIYELALETGFTPLDIAAEHCTTIANLPWHHRDPFDRMIIAQMMSLPAYLLTSDDALTKYSKELVRRVALK